MSLPPGSTGQAWSSLTTGDQRQLDGEVTRQDLKGPHRLQFGPRGPCPVASESFQRGILPQMDGLVVPPLPQVESSRKPGMTVAKTDGRFSRVIFLKWKPVSGVGTSVG